MPRFAAAYKNEQGQTVRERLEGASRTALLAQLRERGFVPISLEKLDEGGEEAEKSKSISSSTIFEKRIKLDDMAVVFRMLATMLGGGLPIIDTLSDVAAQADNPHLRRVLTEVSADIRDGSALSNAMEKHPKVFTKLMIAMAHAGEESGNMANILDELADYLDTQVELRRKIKTGTRYPMFIAGFFMLAISVLFVFILPRFEHIFADFDAELPMLTEIVMGFSSALADNILYILPALLLAGVGTVLFKKTETGKRFFDKLILRMPVIGPMAQKIVVARLSRTLGLLMDGGIDVVESLELTGQVSGNYVFRTHLEEIKNNIVRGSTLAEEMKGRPYFPQMLVRMTAAGETTGSLGAMLERVSRHFTREAAVSIDSVMSLLEPILLALLGLVVAVVVLAVYLPIFQLATAM